jgi:hypothetical protein
VAEIYVPLYLGLILLWPQVWSGDRFALPLFPILLLYAGDTLLRPVRRFGARAVYAVGLASMLAVAVPSMQEWTEVREDARRCGEILQELSAGPYSCWGAVWDEFARAAGWAGENLPEGSAVLSRKPHIFYLVGGLPSRTYPFSDDPDELLSFAEAAGARYVLLDYLASQGGMYVGGALGARPEAFCALASWGPRDAPTQLLGLVEPGSEQASRVEDSPQGPRVWISPCPPDMRRPDPVMPRPLGAAEIPLLTREPGGL